MDAFCIYADEYRPKQPKNTPLFRLLDTHYKEFRNGIIKIIDMQDCILHEWFMMRPV